MKPSLARILAVTAATLVLRSTSAGAHQFWLVPSHYDALPGRLIEIGAVAGTGFRGERQPWVPSHAVHFEARAARTIDLVRAASMGDVAWARFAPSDGGGAMIAFESGFTPIELPGPVFDAYLEDEGLAEPLAARRRAGDALPGRERYRRCSKTWLAGREVRRATDPIGLPLEILPLSVPGAAPSLRVRVLWNGRPLTGALIKTWRSPLAADGEPRDVETRDSLVIAARLWTDERGEATVACAAPGEWLVSLVHMVPSTAPPEADWESTWASLTFVRLTDSRALR
jgi:hypothetical protein